MQIPRALLRDAAERFWQSEAIIPSARGPIRSTAMLCHSGDFELSQGLQVVLLEHGWRVYVEGLDIAPKAWPSEITERLILAQVRESDWVFLLATAKSIESPLFRFVCECAIKERGPNNVLLIELEEAPGLAEHLRSLVLGQDGRIAVRETKEGDEFVSLDSLSV